MPLNSWLHAFKIFLQQIGFTTPYFVLIISGILLLERLIPAHRGQKLWNTGLACDGIWIILTAVFVGTVVAAYTNGLTSLYRAHFDFLTIHTLDTLPQTVRFLIGILIGDVLAWFQHWLKHEVPLFWEFHAVHHSQRELNVFTDLRFHYLEYLISRPIVLLPMIMLGVETPRIAAWALFSAWYTRFYHGNIRTHLGWLRFILVTPQSHRIHHSIEGQHRDKNFGVLFSFWDRIFKTSYTCTAEYPHTGINDPLFPLEKPAGFAGFLATPFRQLLYPFQALVRPRQKTPSGSLE